MPRPAASVTTSDPKSISAGLPTTTAQAMLGDVIFAGMRTPVARTSFERWRQNYCAPFICNMVLCHGSCGDFAEHCPSFSESGRVIHLETPGCMMPNQTAESVPKDNHCSSGP
ncbi:MAG: hypothetical protein JST89_18335 [Cyanobacteria bacterium SZAS-4]|nr:hypothetical protein [Cyanobacteria bacterium SZAS-4]